MDKKEDGRRVKRRKWKRVACSFFLLMVVRIYEKRSKLEVSKWGERSKCPFVMLTTQAPQL